MEAGARLLDPAPPMTQSQREAVLDFLLVAMYVDGPIELSESYSRAKVIFGV